MPNWCNNTLTIRHNDPAMIQKAADAWNSGSFLQTLIPTPDDLLNTIKGWSGDEEKQKANEEQQKANTEKYGYATWWDYRIAEWGTKWDIGFDSDLMCAAEITDNQFTVVFNSAWTPPCAAYDKLEAMEFDIKAYYAESGCDFCGKYEDGQDRCYLISEGDIPADIVEEMNLEIEEHDE